jgi:hypothetical protein
LEWLYLSHYAHENRASLKVRRNHLLDDFACIGMSEENRRDKSQFSKQN